MFRASKRLCQILISRRLDTALLNQVNNFHKPYG